MEQFVDDLTNYQQPFFREYLYPQLFYGLSAGCAENERSGGEFTSLISVTGGVALDAAPNETA